MAVPLDVAYRTVTVVAETFDSVAVNTRFDVPLPPSVTLLSATDTVGGVTTTATSSLVMVPIAVPLAMVTPDGADNVTVNVSLGSTAVSPRMPTCTVWMVTPGAKVMVPASAV